MPARAVGLLVTCAEPPPLDPELTHVGVYGRKGSDDRRRRAQGLNHPEGVAVAPSGAVLVADSNNHRIVVLRGSSH